jgi:hypothetical protein
MSQSYRNLLYHLIFSTKERRPLITPDYQVRLYDCIGGIIRGIGGSSLGLAGPRITFTSLRNYDLNVLCLMSYAYSKLMPPAGCTMSFPKRETSVGSEGTVDLPLVNRMFAMYSVT